MSEKKSPLSFRLFGRSNQAVINLYERQYQSFPVMYADWMPLQFNIDSDLDGLASERRDGLDVGIIEAMVPTMFRVEGDQSALELLVHQFFHYVRLKEDSGLARKDVAELERRVVDVEIADRYFGTYCYEVWRRNVGPSNELKSAVKAFHGRDWAFVEHLRITGVSMTDLMNLKLFPGRAQYTSGTESDRPVEIQSTSFTDPATFLPGIRERADSVEILESTRCPVRDLF